ncbi:MAG: sugar ABC transporter permease [Lachnospiraceae bacterium]|jgi:sn-glycerol 3-phosphate transport system permease protein|nr:sugar ABC transporter permease [Lachnospiraceae bacterium]MDD6789838.1 sugar ABC transporter permease [Lachnospira sp.]MCH4070060.1 sugar ABC transporter permease [Lachnospiraceae bacterium]MCH4108588.1 sugar ABC transporter permease [Lachnospiraceae bacterium]MCI1302707.1 sugar ABC transporter permease [Lachnospiraceae bacterium]
MKKKTTNTQESEKKYKANWKEKIKPYLYIAPAFVGIGLFTIYPVIKVLIWSFQKVNQLDTSKTKWVGMKNYSYLISNSAFQKTLLNTLIYTGGTLAIIMTCALILAFWLNKSQGHLTIFTQGAAFMPHVISSVSIALVFSMMMNPSFGLFNKVLTAIGLPASPWLTSSSTAMPSVVGVASWKAIGYYCLIIIGALQSISASIYEAASLDKAGVGVTLRKITIPMISPQLFFVIITMTIGSFKVFDTVRLLTDGGPNNATSVLVYYIYKQVFWESNIGRACAAGIVLLILVGILTIIYFKLLSKRVHYQ